MAGDAEGFDRSVPLPPQLRISHVRRAIEYIERETSEFVDVYFEQANVFSAVVGIFGVRALDSLSPYKRHKHPDIAQQRFPDLSLSGRLNPPPEQALESKGTTRPWELQSHYNHAGWYIVWRYTIDRTRQMKGREVVVWRVDARFLGQEDWKYERSAAAEGRGGRTHTFGVRKAAKVFRGAAVYQLPGVALKGKKPVLINGA